jgi:hypothetical protein
MTPKKKKVTDGSNLLEISDLFGESDPAELLVDEDEEDYLI